VEGLKLAEVKAKPTYRAGWNVFRFAHEASSRNPGHRLGADRGHHGTISCRTNRSQDWVRMA
jgi:hypothetical protein